MGQNFRAGLERFNWFCANHLYNTNEGDFTELKVQATFNTNMIVNQSEQITDIKNSVGIVSTQTLLENHPFVTDVQAEMDALYSEKPQPPENQTAGNLNL